MTVILHHCLRLIHRTQFRQSVSDRSVALAASCSCACYIHDMNHSSKFAPKAHEGFLLGYGSNSHMYRVYNSDHMKVMETINVWFDETNGSQKEHLPNVIDEPPVSDAIRQMAIGNVKPIEENAPDSSDDDTPMTRSRTH